MARIYISSTYEDLKKEREAAAKAIRRLGHQTVCMEDYVAAPQFPVDKCLQDVRRCDVYIGIFAWRYGFIPVGYDKSITHLEYETAKKAGIPCLIFLTDIKAQWTVEYVTTGEERTKIDQLRNELTNEYTVSFFKNADELIGLISAAVSNLESMAERSFIKFKRPKELIGTQLGKQVPKTLTYIAKEKIKVKENEPFWKKWGLIAASIVIFFIALVFILWNLLSLREMPEDVKYVKSKGIKVEENEEGYWEADYGDEIIMVYIPLGKFTMGSNDYDAEKSAHTVYLDGYWIGKHEVTFSQYDIYCDETGEKNRTIKVGEEENSLLLMYHGMMPMLIANGYQKRRDCSSYFPPKPNGKKQPEVLTIVFIPGEIRNLMKH